MLIQFTREPNVLLHSFPNRLNIDKLDIIIMGAVFRSKDFGRDYRKIIENAIKDLNPDTKDSVIKLFDSWEGIRSKQKLDEILGPDKAQRLIRHIRANKEDHLTDEERDALKDILKESLTFD